MLKKCSCGKEYHKLEDIGNIIGINDVGLWFNCTCKSTLCLDPNQTAATIAPCSIEPNDKLYVNMYTKELTTVIREGRVIYEAATDN